jgi:tRNA G10  N-methylase Trm11
MAEYISSYTTGFNKIVKTELPKCLANAQIISMFDGLVYYKYIGNPQDINSIVFFNNSFIVIDYFKEKHLSFEYMVRNGSNPKPHYLTSNGSFRIRFSNRNRFEKVEKNVVLYAERKITKSSKLRIDRVNPDTEFWYIIRNEGIGFYGQLIKKRIFTEKNLNKGELRPEISFLLCCCAKTQIDEIVCDPFAGYGAIPLQLKESFRYKKLLVSDINEKCVDYLKRTSLTEDENIHIFRDDAIQFKTVLNDSVDVIVTDPPWGLYENMENIVEFYFKMFREMLRILTKRGRILILSARKEEIEKAAFLTHLVTHERIDTLVNGKKASVYLFTQRRNSAGVLD